ncbi:unnamed protein product [Gemmataceae bacterium]|nr:unnamed protein product [Gemmataceae bacterium]VTT99694.1 unnamed protein product [Gemmataceae bacterium]
MAAHDSSVPARRDVPMMVIVFASALLALALAFTRPG